jgi:hypothetical protein
MEVSDESTGDIGPVDNDRPKILGIENIVKHVLVSERPEHLPMPIDHECRIGLLVPQYQLYGFIHGAAYQAHSPDAPPFRGLPETCQSRRS